MDPRQFDTEELRRAAAAHISARSGEDREAQRLAEITRAAAEAGVRMQEIAEIVRESSRAALEERRLAA